MESVILRNPVRGFCFDKGLMEGSFYWELASKDSIRESVSFYSDGEQPFLGIAQSTAKGQAVCWHDFLIVQM